MDIWIFGISIENSYRWRTRLKPWMFDFMPPAALYSETPKHLIPIRLTPEF
jgi:hypothetical protein